MNGYRLTRLPHAGGGEPRVRDWIGDDDGCRGGPRRNDQGRTCGLGVCAILAGSVAGVWRGCQGCVLPRAIWVPAPGRVRRERPDPAAKSYGCQLAWGLPQEARERKSQLQWLVQEHRDEVGVTHIYFSESRW